MKNLLKVSFWAMLAITFAACSNEEPAADEQKETIVIDFEAVELDESGHTDNAVATTVSGVTFNSVQGDGQWGPYWDGGIVVSNQTDKETAGYANQFSVYANAGADNSEQFAVVYYSSFSAANSSIEFSKPIEPQSVAINNSTYVYLALKDGNDGGYGGVTAMGENDWFKVTFTGLNNKEITGKVDFYLADFRDGKTYICTDWTTCDLTALGSVDKILISLDGTDSGEYGLNTPAYVCLDNVTFQQAK